ncbi:hypothetical protein [Marinomonas sp. GJ51-6]|uniref:hypothetical protein n=1 Tax=Marinomonas sp. GJ51-6 TaxID=2992802 RepID=UPI00293493E8|nr:hypothetical protein [Marinomonas sp. GJ51-6]WOD08491.1 hypothetical protein ONZ50_05180 [Marinomonas sp. GJ51-6]
MRIVAELDQLKDIGLDINGHPIYIETFPFEYILEIRLGLFSSDLLERKIRYWRDKFAPHIKITKARIKEGAYDFEFSDLDTHLSHQTSKND